MLDAAGGVLNVAGEEGMVEMEKDRKLLEEDSLLLLQPALQCGYCDNSGNYITKFKENIRTRGNKITPARRGRKAEIRPYRRFFAAGAA